MAQPFYQVGPGCSHEAFEGAYFDSGSVESGHVVYEKSGKYITYGYGDTAGIWCLQLVHGDATANYFSPGVGGDDPPAGTWTGYGEHAGESVTVSAGAVPIATEPDDAEEIAADVEGAEDLGALPPVLGPAEAGMLPPLLVEDEPPAGDAREDEWEEPIATPIEPPKPVRHYAAARGLCRVFNAAVYRLYRTGPYVASWPPGTEGEPPAEGDPPWETCDALPYSPAGTFADGVWFLAMSYFNGVIDSGFYPVGPAGEPYLRLELSGGVEVGNPPQEPSWSVEAIAGGKIRVSAYYAEDNADRADQWALQVKMDAPPSDPVTDPPVTASITGDGVTVWSYDSDALVGTTAHVRLLVRRNDGTAEVPVWVYSPGTVKTVAIDSSGPAAIAAGEVWRGALPVEV